MRHRLINYNTRCCILKIYRFFIYNDPEAEAQRSSAQSALNYKTERESMRIILLGLCFRVTVNKNPRNLEKTILIKGSTKDPLI